jgi:hypothetical protein
MKGLLRAWLRRIKHSSWARRIVLPLLQGPVGRVHGEGCGLP